VEKRLELLEFPQEGLIDVIRGQGGGQGQVAPGDALGQTQEIGAHPLVLAGEHCAGAAETHGHLIGDEEHVVAPGYLPDSGQIAGRLGNHARGALHHRLHDHRGQVLVMRHHQLFQPGETLLPAIFP